MSISLPKLPYTHDALQPYLTKKTLQFHHDRHHQTYVDNTVKLTEGTELAGLTLEGIVKKTAAEQQYKSVFNNAAQVWNHSFYWMCLKPNGGGAPTGEIAKLIQQSYGGYEKFVEQFKNAGLTQFGSGWAWLVLKDDKLDIHKTANADTPLVYGCTPLLTVDVWEHAYYLDYQNRRADYLAAVIDHLINWDFVNSQLK